MMMITMIMKKMRIVWVAAAPATAVAAAASVTLNCAGCDDGCEENGERTGCLNASSPSTAFKAAGAMTASHSVGVFNASLPKDAL